MLLNIEASFSWYLNGLEKFLWNLIVGLVVYIFQSAVRVSPIQKKRIEYFYKNDIAEPINNKGLIKM